MKLYFVVSRGRNQQTDQPPPAIHSFSTTRPKLGHAVAAAAVVVADDDDDSVMAELLLRPTAKRLLLSALSWWWLEGWLWPLSNCK